MRRTSEQQREVGTKDYALREKLAETAEEKKRKAAANVEEESQKIIEEIKQLQSEKGLLFQGPMEKKAFLEFAKEEFRRKREAFLSKPLQAHLRACQEATVELFDPKRIRYDFPDGGVGLIWFVVSAEDIEKAVAGLEDGITEEEREKRIKAIDIKVAQLSKRLEDLA